MDELGTAACVRSVDYDVIFSGGTGVFDDFRDTPLGWPSKLLRWCLAARLRGVPWAFVSVGAGPIVSPISRAMMKQAGALAAAPLLSRRGFLRLHAPARRRWSRRCSVGRISRSCLPAPKAERAAAEPLTVGVGMMTYRGWQGSDAAYDAYIDLHVRLIEWLIAQGYDVRMIIGQAPTDLTAARDVEARLGSKMRRRRAKRA